MPIALAALGERPAVGIISGGIEQFPRRSIASDAVALEITDMGSQRARRTHPAHDTRLDHGTSAPSLQHPRRGKACGAPAAKLGPAAAPSPGKTTSLLSGC